MAATRGSSPAPSNRDISGDEGDAYDLRAMSAGPSGTGSSSYDESTGVRNPDKSMIIRRREANRLAAQRLRVRKKEYQDSLEDRVRQLEEERATLVHRLNEVEPRSSSQAYGWSSGPDRRGSWTGGESSGSRAPGNADTDLRVASLEAANRRLQEELKSVSEENERLQAKLEQWSRWERELATTARSPRPPSRLYSEPSPRPLPSPRQAPFLSPSEASTSFFTSPLPPISTLSPLPQRSPRLSPRIPYPPPHTRPALPRRNRTFTSQSDTQSSRSSDEQSHSLRLPPISPRLYESGSHQQPPEPTWPRHYSHSSASTSHQISTSAPPTRGRTFPPWTQIQQPPDPRW